jgi:predicted nucleic acid-binding protein
VRAFVLDASVALRWFLNAPVPAYAVRVRQMLIAGARAVVPSLWHLEMANGLIVAERRGVLTSADADRSLIDVEALLAQAIESAGDAFSIRQSHAAARAFQLSAYDAVYLETARRERLPLATLDEPLRKGALKAGVELLR